MMNLFTFAGSMKSACSLRSLLFLCLLQKTIFVQAHFFSADSTKNDSSAFSFADAQFDSTDNVVLFTSAYGYSIHYPKAWERDKRAGNNVILYLRAYDAKYPSTFREMLTIIREPVDEGSRSLKDYVMMQNTINENTWQKYKINFKVLNMQLFKLQTFEAYQVFCKLTEVSQEKLLVTFIQDAYAYKIEYTATDATYKDFLQDVRKVINSIVFTE